MKSNLILITVDCLRADRLSCLGYNELTTPKLDKLAKKGALFTNAISVAPYTPSSMKSIFTSTYPLMNGGNLALTNNMVSFVEMLRDNGYSTAGFHSNPWLTKLYHYDRGFRYFFDGITGSGANSLKKTFLSQLINGVHKLKNNNPFKKIIVYAYSSWKTNFCKPVQPYTSAFEINKLALQWLSNTDSNFFLWMHYMDVHEPHLPINKYSPKMSKKKLYGLNAKIGSDNPKITSDDLKCLIELNNAEIREIDELIWSFYISLKNKDILNNTYIIITADHGQQFMEHGRIGHGLDLYEELIHVPLLILGPDINETKVKEVVSLIDLAPTILDILGIEPSKSFKGKSVKPLLHGKKIIASPAISEEGRTEHKRPSLDRLDFSNKKVSLRTNTWKYIYNEHKKHELYNLVDDKCEKNNLTDSEKIIANDMNERILIHIRNSCDTIEKRSTSKQDIIKGIKKLKGRV